MVVGVAITVVAGFTALAVTNPVRVFRAPAAMIAVGQGTNSISGHLEYDYAFLNGSNLVALALGTDPTSNQVCALQIDCGSSAAALVVFDKSNSNITTIATSTSIDTVQQQGFRATSGSDERFVARFNVGPVGDLAGGFLTMEGRLHLDSNGCPHTVFLSLDRDPKDTQFGDTSVRDTEQDARSESVILRRQGAGLGHFIGVLDVASGGPTNVVLIPLGHVTFGNQLDELDVD